eukprot:11164089-Lingulodinium_polyedra.AAC.1
MSTSRRTGMSTWFCVRLPACPCVRRPVCLYANMSTHHGANVIKRPLCCTPARAFVCLNACPRRRAAKR